jgi:hypothetical protein
MSSDDVISLDFVIGLSPSTLVSLGVSDDGSPRVAYATGNVGVILSGATKAQTLLRGHVSGAMGL